MDESEKQVALEAFSRVLGIAGSQSALAKICGCSQGNISQLIANGSPISGRFVLTVEAKTGVSRHDLRPDLYPLEASSPAGRTPANSGAGEEGSLSPSASPASGTGAPDLSHTFPTDRGADQLLGDMAP